MNYQVKIQSINTVEERILSDDDYVQLLGKFAYPEASSAKLK
jgi:hypothetical protein